MTLQHYVEQIMRPQTLRSLGSGLCDINIIITHVHIYYVYTLYHFGDNDREGWQKLYFNIVHKNILTMVNFLQVYKSL